MSKVLIVELTLHSLTLLFIPTEDRRVVSMSSCMEGGGTDCFYGREVGREKSIGFENTSAVGSGKGESLELWHFSKDCSE